MADRPIDNSHFELLVPKAWTAPVIFNSPHSGRRYPDQLLRMTRLSTNCLRKSEDCYIDELFMGCLEAGAPMLRAHCSRAYIDLNREPFEFDPRMFEGDLPGFVNTTSPRVAGGLGTIPRLVAEGKEIYREKLRLEEALERVETVYYPYHRLLKSLVDESLAKAGISLLIDCHSMPSSAAHLDRSRQWDCAIVLGDRFGASCPEEITAFVEQLFNSNGLRVVRNMPYAGGFITQNYGAPQTGSYALQIEVNRALYMNETTMVQSAEFGHLKHVLDRVISGLVDAVRDFACPLNQAAE
jgi:N-formylglutamate amidohydrolase